MATIEDVSVPTADEVLRVVGELDLASLPTFRELLGRNTPASSRLVVDLSGVTFMDCCGLGGLVEAAVRLGDRLQLRGASWPVVHVLQLTEMYGAFAYLDDNDHTDEPG